MRTPKCRGPKPHQLPRNDDAPSTFALRGAAAGAIVAACKTSLAYFAAAGVHVDTHGVARPPAKPDSSSSSSLAQWDPAKDLEPLPKRQRGLWDAWDKSQIARMGTADQQRLADCSGPEGGAYLVAGKVELNVSLTDHEFMHYTRLRLGMELVRPGPCQLARVTRDGERRICGAFMDAKGGHCIGCKIGGAVVAAHGEGCQIIAAATREGGYYSRREQIVPELATPECPSPVLDVDAFGLASADRLLVDFTLRSNLAERYRWGQRATPAASAESDKHERYPAAGGVSVRGACMEILGKHGPELTALLHELADRARAHAVQQGRAPGRLLRKWRCQLSGVAARLVGRQATLSQASAARSWEHPR